MGMRGFGNFRFCDISFFFLHLHFFFPRPNSFSAFLLWKEKYTNAEIWGGAGFLGGGRDEEREIKGRGERNEGKRRGWGKKKWK